MSNCIYAPYITIFILRFFYVVSNHYSNYGKNNLYNLLKIIIIQHIVSTIEFSICILSSNTEIYKKYVNIDFNEFANYFCKLCNFSVDLTNETVDNPTLVITKNIVNNSENGNTVDDGITLDEVKKKLFNNLLKDLKDLFKHSHYKNNGFNYESLNLKNPIIIEYIKKYTNLFKPTLIQHAKEKISNFFTGANTNKILYYLFLIFQMNSKILLDTDNLVIDESIETIRSLNEDPLIQGPPNEGPLIQAGSMRRIPKSRKIKMYNKKCKHTKHRKHKGYKHAKNTKRIFQK
jgi:hypothetical protein